MGNKAPLLPATDFGRWALGFGVFAFAMVLLLDAGQGEFASALTVLVAGGMTVVAGDTVTKNLGFGG